MKTPHTPGPWQLSNATSAGRFVGSGPDGVLGIAMAFGDTPDEQDANARLIAAAPDLLDALRECVTDEGAYSMTRDDLATLKMRIAAINATAKIAIAKAEGAQ